MALVTTTDPEGRAGSGAAFHIGDGWWVTARHVIRGKEFVIAPEGHGSGTVVVRRVIESEAPDDLALIETDFSLDYYMSDSVTIHGRPDGWKVDHIEIGGHLDDWLGDELTMSRYMVMGYPRLPGSERVIVADGGYVNAVVDPELREHPYFIVSGLPRRGFSGGPVLSEFGFLLGVMTDAFPPEDDLPVGHSGVISVEPLWSLLLDNQVFPASNGAFARELFHLDR